mmetsp:Transcript_53434/g.169965  ORF Transcript_53434/g.169965 Transcript_53434/m.169965 type:complete len:593 (-) Transcript_53434:66-1844(-)
MRGGGAAAAKAAAKAAKEERKNAAEKAAAIKYAPSPENGDGDAVDDADKQPPKSSPEKEQSNIVTDALLRSSYGRYMLKYQDTWQAKVTKNPDAFFILSKDGFFRKNIIKLVTHPLFDKVVLVLIVGNCGFLAADDPLCDDECAKTSLKSQVLGYAEYFFTAAFTLEVCLQSIAKGFIFGEGAYLHSMWSWLDLVSVVTAYSFLMPGLGNVSGLRAFRALRPLRTISGVPGMRVLVDTLIESIPLMIDVMVLITWMFFVFGIVGMQMFMGTVRGRCFEVDNVTGVLGGVVPGMENTVCKLPGTTGVRHCPVGECHESHENLQDGAANPNPNFGYTNFDNFLWACLNIMQVLTLQGWSTDQMYLMYDGAGVTSIFYFILLVLFGAFFSLNLLTAIISVKFAQSHSKQMDEELEEADYERKRAREQAKEEEKLKRRLSIGETTVKRLSDGMRTMSRSLSRPLSHGYRGVIKPLMMHPWVRKPRRKVRHLVNHENFGNFITGCILLNTCMMAIEHHNMDDLLADILEMMNLVLSSVFIAEFVLKHLAYGVLVRHHSAPDPKGPYTQTQPLAPQEIIPCETCTQSAWLEGFIAVLI